jgi:hypothetical protein
MASILGLRRNGFVVVVVTALALACGGGGGGSGGSGSSSGFSGGWQGTWQSPSLLSSGSLTLDLSQQGTAITGTATFSGHPCATTCSIAWQAMGWNCSGWCDAGPFQIRFTGGCGGPQHDGLSGSYEIHGGSCDGESGVLTLTRSSSAQAGSGIGGRRPGEMILIDSNGELTRLPVIEPSEPR